MIQTEKVAVSLPVRLISRVEKLRERMGVNRSKFFKLALKAYLDEFPEENKKLAKIYQDIRQTDKELLDRLKKHSYKHLPSY